MRCYVDNKKIKQRSFSSVMHGNTQFKDNRIRSNIMQKTAIVASRPLGESPGGFEENVSTYSDLRHEHILFNKEQPLLANIPGNGNLNNNIGFHSEKGGLDGVGEYFKEARSYNSFTEISNSVDDDNYLLTAINNNMIPRWYNVASYNCQDWVKDVLSDYDKIKAGNHRLNPTKHLIMTP